MKIMLVSGGTGGHIFPALRLLEEIKKQKIADVIFITSSRKQNMDILKKENIEFSTLPIIGWEHRNILYILFFILTLILGTMKSFVLLLKFKPDVVMGFGGYVSGPILFLAALIKIKTVIHEQNVYPGKTNRILAKVVDKIAVNFPKTLDYLKGLESKVIVSGNPVRRGLEKTSKSVQPGFRILVVGGSQGSHTLNSLVPRALRLIINNGLIVNPVSVIHISGYKEYADVLGYYNDLTVEHKVFPFTYEIDRFYHECDFVIARAGATTVTELLYLGKPAILVPYPYGDSHQFYNAEVLKEMNGAVLLEEKGLSVEVLKDSILRLMDKDLLQKMSDSMRNNAIKEPCKILIKEIVP